MSTYHWSLIKQFKLGWEANVFNNIESIHITTNLSIEVGQSLIYLLNKKSIFKKVYVPLGKIDETLEHNRY
jgi:hypothetical protein